MRTAVPGEEPCLRLRVWAAEEDDHSAGRAWRGGEALTLDDFTRSIAVAATLSQVEEDLAETLRTMAAQAKGTVAARRLRLAEDAERGAQAAAEYGERLRQQARRGAEHAGRSVPLESALHQRLADIDRGPPGHPPGRPK